MKKILTMLLTVVVFASAFCIPTQAATENTKTVVVATKDAPVRSGYYEKKSVTFTVKKGTEMTFLEKRTNIYNHDWYRVSYKGETGWIYSGNCNLIYKKVVVGDGFMKGTVNLKPDFVWPLPGNTYISSYAGGRRNPVSGKAEYHQGIDIPARYGVSVKCADDGKVEFAGYSSSYGNYVIVKHEEGLKTLYAHMSSLSVKTGQSIKQGAIVGKVGSTGNSTGNHLHFEVRNGSTRLDPLDYVKPQ